MAEATEPLMTRVEDIPKKLDAILEQLTILSGVAASASRTEKAEARKISSKKVDRAYVKKQEETNTIFKEMNKNMERLVKMQEAQEKILKAQESRQKKTASEIGRKGREKQKTEGIEKLQKMTLRQQEIYWELKEKALKTQMKADKKLNKLQQKYERRRNLKDKIKGLPSDVMQGLGSDFSPSNFLLALGPLGFAAKMISDQTGAGKKLAGSLKQFIPGMRDKDRGGGGRGGNPKEELEKIKYQRWFQKKLGTTKDKYYRQQIGRGSGLKVSESGMLEMDEEALQKKAIAYRGGSKKKVSRGAVQKQAQIADTSKKTGKPTDQQIRKSVTGRPIMWLEQRMEKMSGDDKGGMKLPGVKGGGGGGLLATILPVLGLLAGGAVGLIKGIVKGIKGDKGTPKKPSKTTKKTTTKTQSKKTNQVADRNRKKFLEDPITNAKVESSAKNKPASKKTPKTSPKGLKGKIFNLATGVGMTSGLVALTGGTMEDMGTAALTTAAFSSAQKITEKIATKVTSTVMKTALPRLIPVASMALTIIDGMDDLIKAAKDPTYEGFYFSGRLAETHSGGTKKRGYTAPMSDGGSSQQEQAFDFQHGKGAFQKMQREQALQRHKARGGTEANFIDPNEIATIAQKMDIEKSTKIVNTVVQGTQNFIGTLFQIATEGLSGVKSEEATRRSIPAGAINPNGSIPSGGGGLYSQQSWFREYKSQNALFNQANDAVKEPKKANDLLAGPKGNFTFNARDKHYALPDGQILSTNRGINTLPESRSIQANRFSGGATGGEDQTAQILQQILAALQKGGTGNAAVINNTTRLISPENFASGGVFV